MKSGHKARLLALATQLASRKYLAPPLIVSSDSDTLPPDVIEAARRTGRSIVNVYFVKAPGGGLGAMVDNVGDRITWSRPEDAPMVDVFALENGELKVVDRRPLERPVIKGPIDNAEDDEPCA